MSYLAKLNLGKLFLKFLYLIIATSLTLILYGCEKTEVYSSLPESEINDMLAILRLNGINAEKVKNRKQKKGVSFSLLVDDAEMAEAILLFRKFGYPREKFDSIEDIFKKEGLVSSPLEERLRFIYAMEQEIQETLSQIDGVVTSRVNIVLPENDPFDKNISPASASVYIKYLPSTEITRFKSNIKLIVEKSIEGLEYDKVSVVMLPSRVMEEFNSETRWINLLGVRMPKESKSIFVLVLVIFSSIIVLLSAYIAWRFFMSAQQKNEEKPLVDQVLRKIKRSSVSLPPKTSSPEVSSNTEKKP